MEFFFAHSSQESPPSSSHSGVMVSRVTVKSKRRHAPPSPSPRALPTPSSSTTATNQPRAEPKKPKLKPHPSSAASGGGGTGGKVGSRRQKSLGREFPLKEPKPPPVTFEMECMAELEDARIERGEKGGASFNYAWEEGGAVVERSKGSGNDRESVRGKERTKEREKGMSKDKMETGKARGRDGRPAGSSGNSTQTTTTASQKQTRTPFEQVQARLSGAFDRREKAGEAMAGKERRKQSKENVRNRPLSSETEGEGDDIEEDRTPRPRPPRKKQTVKRAGRGNEDGSDWMSKCTASPDPLEMDDLAMQGAGKRPGREVGRRSESQGSMRVLEGSQTSIVALSPTPSASRPETRTMNRGTGEGAGQEEGGSKGWKKQKIGRVGGHHFFEHLERVGEDVKAASERDSSSVVALSSPVRGGERRSENVELEESEEDRIRRECLERYGNPADPCPYCQVPLPLDPTPHLVSLRASIAARSEPAPTKSHPNRLVTSWQLAAEFCSLHEAEVVVLPLGRRAGYPATVEFAELEERVERGWVGEALKRRVVRDPRRSGKFLESEREIREKGKSKWGGVGHQTAKGLSDRIMPGYYGQIGRAILTRHFQNLLKWGYLPELEPRPDGSLLIAPLSANDFITHVLVPEASVLLIMEDEGYDPSAELVDGEALFAEWYDRCERVRGESVDYGRWRFREDSEEGKRAARGGEKREGRIKDMVGRMSGARAAESTITRPVGEVMGDPAYSYRIDGQSDKKRKTEGKTATIPPSPISIPDSPDATPRPIRTSRTRTRSTTPSGSEVEMGDVRDDGFWAAAGELTERVERTRGTVRV